MCAVSVSNVRPAERGPLVFRTGGLFMLVGVWFVLLGLALAAGAIFLATLPEAEGPPVWLRVILFLVATMPLAVAGLGFWLTFGGEKITLDVDGRKAHIRYGRWWTWKRETRAFGDFYAVELRCQAIRVGVEHRGGPPTYVIRLLSGGGELELANTRNSRKARAVAERVARCTRLPLHDDIDGARVVRAADALDESLAERARRLGEQVEWRPPPGNHRIEVHQSGDETIIDLPQPHGKMIVEGVLSLLFLLVVYGGTLAGVAFVLRSVLREWSVFGDGSGLAAVVWAVPLVPVLHILILGGVLLIARERIVVSPRLVKRVWRLPVGSWTRRIPADAIEELLDTRDDVLIRTDRGTCRLEFALDKVGRRWLRAALRYLLVKGGAGGAVVSEDGGR